MAETIAIYTRQDITIQDPGCLVAAARWITPQGPGIGSLHDPVSGPHEALARLVMEHGPHEVAGMAADFGLRAGDASTVLTVVDSSTGSWLEAFPAGPVGRVIHQVDSPAAEFEHAAGE
jgi:hypothetical protein